MPETTVAPGREVGPRTATAPPPPFLELIEEVAAADTPPSDDVFHAIADMLLDALLAGSAAECAAAVTALEPLEARTALRAADDVAWTAIWARIDTLLALAANAADRLPSPEKVELVRSSLSLRILERVADEPGTLNADLVKSLRVSKEHLCRATALLRRDRVLSRAKIGREVAWSLTPHGQAVLEAARDRAPEQPIAHGSVGHAVLVNAATNKPFDADLLTTARSVISAHNVEARSRALLAVLLAHRSGDVVERLSMWKSLNEFAEGPLTFSLPDIGAAAEEVARLTHAALETVARGRSRSTVSKLPAVAWDAWAAVEGRHGSGIVLIDAKTQPGELKQYPPVFPGVDLDAWENTAFRAAREALTARRAWSNVSYHDATVRLAFVQQLVAMRVPVWWMNVYFVAPYKELSRAPASAETWEGHLAQSRDALGLKTPHQLSTRIRHEFFTVPTLTDHLTDLRPEPVPA